MRPAPAGRAARVPAFDTGGYFHPGKEPLSTHRAEIERQELAARLLGP